MTGFAIVSESRDGAKSAQAVLALTSGRGGFYIGNVKWRNQFLALFCLIIFFAFGVFYFRYWVIQKPFGIVLFIGEGLDAQTLAAARIYSDASGQSLALDSLGYVAHLKNRSLDSAVPDQAAAATALSTGTKVRNGALAIDSEGRPLTNLLDLARDSGRMTGLITNGNVTSPTIAAFYAHTPDPGNWEDIARQLANAGDIDLVLGGGFADFLPQSQGGRRTDGKDLLSKVGEGGYDVVKTLADLEDIPRWRRAKLFGLFSESELPFADQKPGNQPTLSDMVRRAIELLQYHRGGYLLIVDGQVARKAARQNQGERKLSEAIEFDRAVSVALQYAGNKSAIFVCSDVVNSTVNRVVKFDLEYASSHSPDSDNAVSAPSFDPSIPKENNGTDREAQPAPSTLFSPSAGRLRPCPDDLPEDVSAFGFGLGADALHGTQESTAIFDILRNNL